MFQPAGDCLGDDLKVQGVIGEENVRTELSGNQCSEKMVEQNLKPKKWGVPMSASAQCYSMTSRLHRRAHVLRAVVSLACICGFAGASTAETSEPKQLSQDSQKNSQGPSIVEVIVTATKRNEAVQDIPLSVTALDEQLLLKTGAVDLIDYATQIPNLSFGATSAGPLSLFSMQIRGVAGQNTTGFYIDDVPLPESMNPRVMDISRIEVLRGPQGSLYGARSMGGTVRLITNPADPTTPEFKTHASLGAVAEGDMDYAVDSSFNVPIAPNLAFRGNVYYQRQTGVHDIVVDNPTVAGDEITHKNADDGEYWGLQAKATWKPTERLTVEPRFMYQNSHLDWFSASDLRPDNFTAPRLVDRADPSDEEWSISSLTVSQDTDWGRFTSATAFLDQEIDGREDFSEYIHLNATPSYYPPGGTLFILNRDSRQITEEARFTSEFNGRLQFTAGVFYSKSKQVSLVPCSFAVGFGEAVGIPSLGDCVYSADAREEVEEAAFFGEFEYAVLANLSLTLGGRYFENTRTDSTVESGFASANAPLTSGKQSENGFNPKVALKWDATSDWTLYSSAAKGYRIGGVNLSGVPISQCGDELAALGLSAAPKSFDSDSLWSYEIGSKSTHANGRFSLNAAAFLIDWSNIIQSSRLACGYGFTQNAGTAEIKGAEIEIAGQAVDNLHYALGIGYTDGEITDPESAPGVVKGDRIAQVPEWTFNGNADYRFNLGAREGYFFLSYSWVDSSISVNQGLRTPRVRDSYGVLDARLGTTFGKWDISLSGKNLTNQHANLSDTISFAAETPGRPRYIINRPRTIGVDFRWVF